MSDEKSAVQAAIRKADEWHTPISGAARTTASLYEQWLARAEKFERVAAKLQQRARDIRHTAEMVRKPMVPVLKCFVCEAHEGEEHYSFCTHAAALRGELVS